MNAKRFLAKIPYAFSLMVFDLCSIYNHAIREVVSPNYYIDLLLPQPSARIARCTPIQYLKQILPVAYPPLYMWVV